MNPFDNVFNEIFLFFIFKYEIFHYICEIKPSEMSIKVTLNLTNEQAKVVAEAYNAKHKPNPSYSIAKTAREIGVSESTLRRHIKEGLIKTEIIGKSPKITQEEIDRYLKK